LRPFAPRDQPPRGAFFLIPVVRTGGSTATPACTRNPVLPTRPTRLAPPASRRGKRPLRGRPSCRSGPALRSTRTPVNNRLGDRGCSCGGGESPAPALSAARPFTGTGITALRGRRNPSGPQRLAHPRASRVSRMARRDFPRVSCLPRMENRDFKRLPRAPRIEGLRCFHFSADDVLPTRPTCYRGARREAGREG
jgi:hypothetical protein